jgi:DNA mismatch endonuclease (patch repair protein)
MASPPRFRHSPRDRHTPRQRSENMRDIKAFGTRPERIVHGWIREIGRPALTHVHSLPGRPDFVFPDIRKVVLVYGDFWHGWRFPSWRGRLPPGYWRAKIEGNRARDARNRRRLRRLGWEVLVIWEHQLVDADAAIACLRSFLGKAVPAGNRSLR